MESKKDNISTYFLPVQKRPDVVISMSFPCKGNWYVLNSLKNHNCNYLERKTEITVVAYLIAEMIYEKLMGNPKAVEKSRAGGLKCNLQNDQFCISWHTDKSMTYIKKTINLALSAINPAKMLPRYKKKMSLFKIKTQDSSATNKFVEKNYKPNDAEFNYVVDELIKGIKSNVCFIIVGKLKLDAKNKTKIKNMVSDSAKKLKMAASKGKKNKPGSIMLPDKKTRYLTVKATGFNAVVVADYLESTMKQKATPNSNNVIIYTSSTVIPAPLKSPNRIANYVKTYYSGAKDFVGSIIYSALDRCVTDCKTAIKFAKSRPSPSSMTAIIKKSIQV